MPTHLHSPPQRNSAACLELAHGPPGHEPTGTWLQCTASAADSDRVAPFARPHRTAAPRAPSATCTSGPPLSSVSIERQSKISFTFSSSPLHLATLLTELPRSPIRLPPQATGEAKFMCRVATEQAIPEPPSSSCRQALPRSKPRPSVVRLYKHSTQTAPLRPSPSPTSPPRPPLECRSARWPQPRRPPPPLRPTAGGSPLLVHATVESPPPVVPLDPLSRCMPSPPRRHGEWPPLLSVIGLPTLVWLAHWLVQARVISPSGP
jgi:hypothetical protein